MQIGDWWNKAAQKGWLRRVTEPSSDNDDDAMMRVISVCFSNVFSFLWLNHLISGIMTDKKSVLCPLQRSQISALGGPWSQKTLHGWRWQRWWWGQCWCPGHGWPGWVRWQEMGWGNSLNQHSHCAGQTPAKTLDTLETNCILEARVSEHDENTSFPCVSEVLLCYAICVTPCHAFDWFSFPRPGIIVENVGRPRKLN